MASAYILAIRNHNGCEVLLAQKNVIDFRRTLPADNTTLRIYDYPGEYVLPGGEIREGENPARTALRHFCELMQVAPPRVATLQSFYEIEGQAYFWLLSAEDNPWLSLWSNHEIQRLNNYYKERDGAVYIDDATGRLASGWPSENYGELHALLWTSASRAAELLSPRGWLSKWQEEQYDLVRRAMPAYRNYSLFQIHNNRRMPSAECEDVLRYLNQNPLVMTVQVYKDYQRLSPMLTEGVGQIINSHGEVRLNGRDLKFAVEPLLGNSYFVVASNGAEVVMMPRTMIYIGKNQDGVYTFVSKISDAELDEPASSPTDPAADE
jgi:hypothetical protein